MHHNRTKLIETFLEYNSKINLSAIRDADGVYHKHILDSLEINNCIKLEAGKTLADLGTGWGFPLLPIAMTNPDLKCTGIDARKKKTIAVQDMANALGVTNIRTLWSRAEDVTEKYDYVTSRAVWYADKLFPRSVPLLKKWGYLILYKQLTPEEDELIFALAEHHKLWFEKMHHYKLEGDDVQRVIYMFKR